MKRNTFFAVALIFHTAVLGVLLTLWNRAPEWDFRLLVVGNSALAGVTLLSYFLSTRAPKDRPESFVRGVYSGTLLKLFLIAGGILVYFLLERGHLHKPSLAALGGLYIIYTALETAALQRSARTK